MRHVFFFSILALLGLALNASAQDSHYWDNQYGTKGELLGGAVVGSPTDLSATYYNPGWIAMGGDPSLLVTTMAAEAYSIHLKDGLGQGTDPKSTVFATSPGYLAGRFTVGDDHTWQWAYTYLQKVKFEFDASGIRVDEVKPPAAAENIWFSGEAFRKAQANEYWYGFTFSRKIASNVGFGVSPYVVNRSMKSRIQSSASGLNATNSFAQAHLVDEYSFWHVRLLAKIGLAVEQGNWSYGLTMTTPSLGLFGSGHVYTTSSTSGLDRDNNDIVDPPFLSADYQEDLSATWKSPLSIAAGAHWKAKATGVYLTVEWFNATSLGSAMDPEPFRAQSEPENVVYYNLDYGAKSLINFAVAFDHAFSRKFSLYGAFRSDYSSIPSHEANNLQISNWDLWHVTTGAAFTFLNMEFTSGLQFSFGEGSSERFVNFNLDDNGDVIGDFGAHEVTYRRIKALIGFNLPFGETTPQD